MSGILFLANLNPNKFGSLEESVQFLGIELIRYGHKCYFGSISPPEQLVAAKLAEAGVVLLTIPVGSAASTGFLARIRQAANLQRLIRDHRIDLVHVNLTGITDPALLGIFFSRVRIVFTDHFSGAAKKRTGVKKIIFRCIHWVVALRVSRYVGISEFVRRRLKITHHVSGAKTETIYNGVNVKRFKPRDRADARRMLGIPQQRKVLLSVAMLIPEKGVQYLIDAAALLVNDFRETEMLVLLAGEGWCQSDLEQRAEKLGIADRIQFLGRRSDVETLTAAADIVVVPSVWQEGFGLIIAEAMASGRPVVATDVGGISELIDDGKNGLLVKPEDSRALAGAINSLLKDEPKCRLLADAALIRTHKQFSLSQQVARLVRLYGDILA
jgi:glycosyltransferase involved in cell wall biosynthesis